jgi:hypothetical protein
VSQHPEFKKFKRRKILGTGDGGSKHFEKSVTVRQITWCHIPSHLNSHKKITSEVSVYANPHTPRGL